MAVVQSKIPFPIFEWGGDGIKIFTEIYQPLAYSFIQLNACHNLNDIVVTVFLFSLALIHREKTPDPL